MAKGIERVTSEMRSEKAQSVLEAHLGFRKCQEERRYKKKSNTSSEKLRNWEEQAGLTKDHGRDSVSDYSRGRLSGKGKYIILLKRIIIPSSLAWLKVNLPS